MTNSGVDVTDLYLEKLSGDGYLYDGTTKPFTTARRPSRSPAARPRRSSSGRPTTDPCCPTATANS